MKKASIAVALVLVFGLFAAAFSLTPAIAQYGTSPSPSSTGNSTSTGSTAAAGNTTTSSTGNATTGSNTTSTNATSTQGSTFSARGSIASMIFDTGTTVTNNTNETGTSSTNATSMGNTTTSSTGNMTSSGNTTLSGNATGNTTLSQTIVGGDNSTGNTTGMTGTNTTTSSTGNSTGSSNNTSSSNATSTASQLDQPYILSGDWNLDVKDGIVSDFKANWTMVHIDGTGRHTHEVSNFQSTNGSTVQLKQNGTTVIFGTADVLTNGSPKWTGVNAVITIDNMNVASISFASEETDDHFHGQPIYGPVYSLTENGKEMIQAPGGTSTSGNATGGNMTGNATQGAQNALNQTGNALKNATEGIKDFFNGTG